MVDAGDLAHVLDVGDHVVERRRGRRVLDLAPADERLEPARSLASMPASGGRCLGLQRPVPHGRLTNRGTKVTMQPLPRRPSPPARRRARCAGGRTRRSAEEWEKMTGAVETSIASRITSALTCERSTIMPIRFISRDDLAAEVRQPAQHRLVGRGVGPEDVLVVRQGQVAHARGGGTSAAPPVTRRSGGRPRRRSARRSAPTPRQPPPRRPWSPAPAGRRTARP